ncbi:hypothetical protein D3C75_820710 [compost metagenome]
MGLRLVYNHNWFIYSVMLPFVADRRIAARLDPTFRLLLPSSSQFQIYAHTFVLV